MEDIFENIVKLRADGQRGALATIVGVRGSAPSSRSAKMLVREDWTVVGTIGGGCVEAEVFQAAREVMEEEQPRTLRFDLNENPKYDTGLVCGGSLEIFIEPLLPAAVLYLFGAGHLGLNVYRVARIAGFEVAVVAELIAFRRHSSAAVPHTRWSGKMPDPAAEEPLVQLEGGISTPAKAGHS